jgi:hypothetical protein
MHKRKKEYEADVIDFGTSDAYVSDDDNDNDAPQQEGEEGDVEMGDEDVEPMELGSPAHVPVEVERRVDMEVPDVPEDMVDFDEDDELEAQMMAAMEEEVADEEMGGVTLQQEESDESEAE